MIALNELKYLRIIFLTALLSALWSCSLESDRTKKDGFTAGTWKWQFEAHSEMGDWNIPIYAEADSSGTMAFVNWTERIVLDSVRFQNDSFEVKMPYFHSLLRGKRYGKDTLKGEWIDYSRADYSIPFTAVRAAFADTTSLNAFKRTYDVTFSPTSATDMYKAVGLFEAKGDLMSGTFLTESGDYRYLQGELLPTNANNEKPFYLACFDGTHLFHFTGVLAGDSIRRGEFHSGKHWKEEWNGRLDATARLKDPDSLTVMKDGYQNFEFVVKDENGAEKKFDAEALKGKVTIVQIFGSWCPNCYDEAVFVRELYAGTSKDHLQVIPVAFERGDQFSRQVSLVKAQFNEMQLPYPPYFGGSSSKDDAARVFPMLNSVMSFPTMIILDKTGAVRKIHTGFYGPGTGAYYTRNTSKLKSFIEGLLAE